MRRCALLLMTVLLVFTGCGRVAPQPTSPPSSRVAKQALIIGATPDQTTKVLAELYVQGLAAKGRPARVIEVEDDANTLVSRLMSGEVDLAPSFAWTAAQSLQVDSDEAATLVSDLAAALDGEVAVLKPSKVDRAWRYLASGSGRSLNALKSTDRVVGSQRWLTAADGPQGLATVYRRHPTVATVEATAARLAQVKAGAIGAFEGADPGIAGLQPVADPLSMVVADPQLALLRIGLSSDDTVLDVIQQLHRRLDNRVLSGIRARAAAVGVPAAAGEWLKANPLT